MSNKVKEKTVRPAAKPALVPKLRFPQFRDAGGWDNKPMDQLYSFKGTNSLSRDKLDYTGGSVKNIHYGDIHTKFSQLFDIRGEDVPFIIPAESIEKANADDYCVETDVVFADASEDLEDIGKCIELVELNGQRLLSGSHTILARQKHNNLAVGFGGHLFHATRIRAQIKKEAQGAKVFGISPSRLSRIEICYPSDKKEQKKIADCLSSLDELITLEARKRDTLKAHKKGLMQQLFPAEGETVPKLRFPEFRDAGEWILKTISSVCKTYSGGTPATTQKDFYGGDIPFIRSAEIDKENTELFLTPEGLSNSAAKIVSKGDVLVALYGANSGDVALARIDGAINQAILCLKSENSNAFIYQYLFHIKNWLISTYIQGGQGNLSGEIVKSIELGFPKPEEQQRIADCLSSLDDLITLEAQKLDTLRALKKGLMQQLFPALDEVQG